MNRSDKISCCFFPVGFITLGGKVDDFFSTSKVVVGDADVDVLWVAKGEVVGGPEQGGDHVGVGGGEVAEILLIVVV